MICSIRDKGVVVIAFFCLLYVYPLNVFAQSTVVPPEAKADSTTMWHLTTMDENEFFGIITERTFEYIRLDTETLGEINIPIEQIKQMKIVEDMRIVNGEIWPENAQASRYFLGSNGMGVRRGQGYFHNIWIFFNQITFGITDFASLGVGMVPIIPSDSFPLWLSPKLSIPLAGKDGLVHVGVGAMLGNLIRFQGDGFGVTFGSMTVGTRDINASIGLAKGFDEGELSDQSMLTFGAMARTSKRSYVMVEGLLWDLDNEAEGGILIGGRSAGRRLTLDFGLIIPVIQGGTAFMLPWLSVSAPFGN